MICRLQKHRKPLHGLLVDILAYQSKSKALAVSLSKYRIKVVRLFQNQKGRFKNISKKKLTEFYMLEYFKFSKHKGCKIYLIPAPREVKSLIIREKH